MEQVIIAHRVPPGDKWKLLEHDLADTVYSNLTAVLNAYYNIEGYRGSYILNPIDGTIGIPVKDRPRQEISYDIYGET